MRKAALLVAFIVLVSCNSSDHFSSYHELSSGWPSTEMIQFTIPESQVASSDVFIHIRNSNDYQYANLFLIAELRDSVQVIARDTLEYAMADPKGNWLGTGFLEVKESKLSWKENWLPPHKGPFFVEISQRVRNNGSLEGVSILDGILNVGIAIEPQMQPQTQPLRQP
jgi:gliding motility-associated lipoprotein GldH